MVFPARHQNGRKPAYFESLLIRFRFQRIQLRLTVGHLGPKINVFKQDRSPRGLITLCLMCRNPMFEVSKMEKDSKKKVSTMHPREKAEVFALDLGPGQCNAEFPVNYFVWLDQPCRPIHIVLT